MVDFMVNVPTDIYIYMDDKWVTGHFFVLPKNLLGNDKKPIKRRLLFP